MTGQFMAGERGCTFLWESVEKFVEISGSTGSLSTNYSQCAHRFWKMHKMTNYLLKIGLVPIKIHTEIVNVLGDICLHKNNV